jgi:hypothetical protein
MRKSGICPKCSNSQLLHVGTVADAVHVAGTLRPMRLAVVLTGHGLFGEKI